MRLDRRETGLLAGVDIFRRGAEQREFLVLRIIEQHAFLRGERRAVVQHQRRAAADGRDKPVPHHPAAGGEVEDAVAGAGVGLQAMLFQMLQQRAAGAMHDAFRHAGGARRIENESRLVERQPFEGQRLRRKGFEECVERDGIRQRLRKRIGFVQIRNDHHRLRGRQLRDDALELVGERERLAVVPIAVDRDEHLGLDLAETIQHAALAEIRRAG